MAKRALGMGELHVTNRPGDQLVIYGLGSCVALVAREPRTGAIGMAHVVLPTPESAPHIDAKTRPGYFAKTALDELLRQFRTLFPVGRVRLEFKMVGGGHPLQTSSIDVGKRNVLAVRKALWQAGFAAKAEETGGKWVRTIRIEVGTPTAHIHTPGRPDRVL